MKINRLTEHLEFTINYANGEAKDIKEGILLEFAEEAITLHLGISRRECLFAAADAMATVIVETGLRQEFERYIMQKPEETTP